MGDDGFYFFSSSYDFSGFWWSSTVCGISFGRHPHVSLASGLIFLGAPGPYVLFLKTREIKPRLPFGYTLRAVRFYSFIFLRSWNSICFEVLLLCRFIFSSISLVKSCTVL